jgi:hypothetical protein
MSQRTVDEVEQRRGLTLGLTLAEILLLLLFLVLLALSWRVNALQQEAKEERERAATITQQLHQVEDIKSALGALLAQLRSQGELNGSTLEELIARLRGMALMEKENAALKEEINKLSIALGSLQAVGADLSKLKQINDAFAAAVAINPSDPAEFLKRAVEVMKVLGTQTKPNDVTSLNAMNAQTDTVKALAPVIALGRQINPNDPIEGLKRGAEVLIRIGRNANPEDIMPLEQQTSLAGELTWISHTN